MGDTKFLDYGGLSYFWNKVDAKKQDRLTIDTELDSTSTNPVENRAIAFAIDNLNSKIENGNSSATLVYTLLNKIIDYDIIVEDPVENTYVSTIYCVKNGITTTIYFDIETNYGEQVLFIDNLIPEGWRPFKKIHYITPQDSSNFNNIMISTDGRIGITSYSGIYNVHCAITYLIVTDDIQPYIIPDDPDIKYSVSAKLVKLGNYLPTYSNGAFGGYNVIGQALTTDTIGSQFSGYQGNYTPYVSTSENLTEAVYFTSAEKKFYWNKILTNEIDSNNKGYLYSFDDCYEERVAAGTVTETELINKGIEMVSELATTQNEIQYFVSGFGTDPWIGGVLSDNNSEIADKAYGGTSGAASYNGRFYWQTAVLSHMFRFVPASASPTNTSIPVERDGSVIGYIDKIIPLKIVDSAYTWANFSNINGSTWRTPKLVSTGIEYTTLEDNFDAHLVFEDWNENTSGGNKYNTSNYYQRIDARLIEDNNGIDITNIKYRDGNHGALTRSWKTGGTSQSLIIYTGVEFE